MQLGTAQLISCLAPFATMQLLTDRSRLRPCLLLAMPLLEKTRKRNLRSWRTPLRRRPNSLPLEEDSEEVIDTTVSWVEEQVTVDPRASAPSACFQGRCMLHLPGKEFASAAQYFLRFLPTAYISEVVIPAINEHAQSVDRSFVPVTYDEYLYWIALFVMMTVIRVDDLEAYFHLGDSPIEIPDQASIFQTT